MCIRDRLEDITIIRRGRRYALFNYAVPGVYRRVLRQNRYDVIVDDLNKVPFFSPLFTRRPVVALVHHLFGGTVFQETNPIFGSYVFLSEMPVARIYRRSSFIAVSPSTADDLESRGVAPERITVIPNGLPDSPDDGSTWDELITRPKSAEPAAPVPDAKARGRSKRPASNVPRLTHNYGERRVCRFR